MDSNVIIYGIEVGDGSDDVTDLLENERKENNV